VKNSPISAIAALSVCYILENKTLIKSLIIKNVRKIAAGFIELLWDVYVAGSLCNDRPRRIQ
jgi:hypothetical protein